MIFEIVITELELDSRVADGIGTIKSKTVLRMISKRLVGLYTQASTDIGTSI
jgi:hypothetical protein